MSQPRRAVGNTVFYLTGLRFQPQTFRSRDARVTAQIMALSANKLQAGEDLEAKHVDNQRLLKS